MKRFIFWSVLHKNISIALTEDLSKYAQGETFWQAMLNLCETLQDLTSSSTIEESDLNARLRMYHETGINKVEIFVGKEGNRYAVKCANSRSFLDAKDIQEALRKYVAARAKTSFVNTGDPKKI